MIARSKAEMRIRRILKFVQDAPGSTRTVVANKCGPMSSAFGRIDACVAAGALIEDRLHTQNGRPPRVLTCSDAIGDLDMIDGLPADLADAIFAALESGVIRE